MRLKSSGNRSLLILHSQPWNRLGFGSQEAVMRRSMIIVRYGTAACVLIVSSLLVARPAAAMTITPIWDSSITALGNAGVVESAFTAVANDYARSFSNPVNVYVNVSWGRVAGTALPSNAVGASSTNLYGYFTYAQVKSFLAASSAGNPADTALATALRYLPATAPAGTSKYVIASAEAKALGIIPATQSSPDGYIGFAGSTAAYSFTPGTLTSKLYDFQSVAAHEIAEILGRISGVDNGSWRTPFDLYRYAAPGTLGYAYKSAAYFSIDGGRTNLANFNYSTSGGDRGDWATTSSSADAQDAFIGKGQRKNITAVDLTALDVLGWGGANLGNAGGNPQGIAFGLVNPGAVPEPATWTLLIAGFGVTGGALRRLRAVVGA